VQIPESHYFHYSKHATDGDTGMDEPAKELDCFHFRRHGCDVLSSFRLDLLMRHLKATLNFHCLLKIEERLVAVVFDLACVAVRNLVDMGCLR
jgi:hypothetical protein